MVVVVVTVGVVVVIVPMFVNMLAVMDVVVHVRRAIGVGVRMTVDAGNVVIVRMLMLVRVIVVVTMDGAIGMNMGVFVRPAFDPDFAVTASANCAHSCLLFYSMAISLTRISVPPVG